jgi:hypothetical protein
MEMFSIRILIVLVLFIDLLFVFFIFFFIKKLKTRIQKDISKRVVDEVIKIISPFLKDAEQVADTFDEQIKEKSRLVKEINGRLDTRIISLNLLLNRANAYLNDTHDCTSPKQANLLTEIGTSNDSNAHDQQELIIKLHNSGISPDNISKKLALSKGEVDLVIELKNKFLKMEQNY